MSEANDIVRSILKKQLPWSWLFYALVVCIAWPMLWSAPLVDEPTMAWVGWQVAQGKLLYRDVFEFVMPGTALLTAGMMKLFSGGYPGVAFWVAIRGVNLLLWLLSMAVMEGCLTHCQVNTQGRWFYRLWMASFLLASPWVLLELNHHLYSSHLCVWALGAVFQSIQATATEKQREQWLVLAGLLIGLAICFTQSLGVIMSVCLGLCILQMSRAGELALRSVLYYAIAVLMPALLVCGYFAAVGAFASFWDCVVMYPLTSEYREVNSFPYQPLFFDFMQSPINLVTLFSLSSVKTVLSAFIAIAKLTTLAHRFFILIFTILGIIASFWGLFVKWDSTKQNTEEIRANGFIFSISIGFFLSTLSYPSIFLFAFHTWAFVVALLCVFKKKIKHSIAQSALGIGIFIFALRCFYSPLDAFFSFPVTLYVQDSSSVSTLSFSPSVLSEAGVVALNKTVAWIHRSNSSLRSGKRPEVFVFNSEPLIYILLNAENPTPYPYLAPLINTPKQMLGALTVLKKKPPEWIVWDHYLYGEIRDVRFQKFPPERLKMPTEFRQWVLGHYKRVFEAYPYVVYEHRGN